jgi:ubiquinone/menaquinone biosynthesis C-methylase UbiE
MIWVGYTTEYRKGGLQMERAAKTLAADRAKARPDCKVVLAKVESKVAFVASLHAAQPIDELHLVAHAGLYGPMFGTTDWPEQLSPHEWRSLQLDFAPGGQAWFLACRSARWFAPFFANTFQVPTHGFHWYTSYSSQPQRFRWQGPGERQGPLYVMGAPGRKSHGLSGSVLKYVLGRGEAPKRFEPQDHEQGSYDGVAALYDVVFDDIRVRQDEWKWLDQRVPEGARVLDLGCGNGALLQQLSPRILSGVGLDLSAGQLARARERTQGNDKLRFEQVTGPQIPLQDNSVDIATSLLSFRYLDWDPLMRELERVLTPQGRLLLVDMAAAPLRTRELPRALGDSLLSRVRRRAFPQAAQALQKLVAHPQWQEMLTHNPIRGEHEYRWYLESRFPGQRMELLNLGWHARVLAFDSGPISQATLSPMQYP